MNDTIFALATAPGRSGIAVIRVSGPQALEIAHRLGGARPLPRHASLRPLRDPVTGEVIDRGLVLAFPGPASFTGEDVVEFHVHGGRAITHALAEILSALGLRPAERGEFTRRAVLAGRMDLVEAEGLADLVEAETLAQRRQALRQMDGALGALYDDWRRRLVMARARVEALIDFADEGIDDAELVPVWADVADLRQQLAVHLADGRRGERVREGFRVALVGAPNAGKSSLLNWFAGRDAAIVSSVPGTTRDLVEVVLDLGGYRVVLVDTAGLRETTDPVEREGVRRAEAAVSQADLVLHLVDGREPEPAEPRGLVVRTKADLLPQPDGAISVVSGQGLDALRDLVATGAAEGADAAGAPVITRLRHRQACADALAALDRATGEDALELKAEGLRSAAHAIGRITGAVDLEEVLDVIFREFCIGK
ncbi:tRNA uridine-5-carboxymethylaminomethyl(34) synthesis GTPase MnmE [Zavarzinia sp. CC-PAN008]|uniref:tRNA uridine-5-carboxymethylaminomethyl(34) synthesis GTPase MnmE n=1 Tax=Zavarzinia sp. CC-PAN008 TaxID=3243332 RepID=UPI003F74587F